MPNIAAMAGQTDQTITIRGTSVANSSLTATCTVTIYGRSVPSAPVLTGATPGHGIVKLTWKRTRQRRR